MTLPNFMIIGAAKAGTTSLYHYLRQHPDIFMSPEKEPRFFATDMITESNCAYTNRTDYEALFKTVGTEHAIGEASNLYLFSKNAADEIEALIPEARLIAMLRDPTDRAYSHFCYLRRDGKEAEYDFGKVIIREIAAWRAGRDTVYLARGLYGEQLDRYFSRFSKDQIKVYLYDDFRSSPQDVIRDIYTFIGVDGDFTPNMKEVYNLTTVPESGLKSILYRVFMRQDRLRILVQRLMPHAFYWKYVTPIVHWAKKSLRTAGSKKPLRMDSAIRSQLVKFYQKDIEQTEKLTGFDLSAWRS